MIKQNKMKKRHYEIIQWDCYLDTEANINNKLEIIELLPVIRAAVVLRKEELQNLGFPSSHNQSIPEGCKQHD